MPRVSGRDQTFELIHHLFLPTIILFTSFPYSPSKKKKNFLSFFLNALLDLLDG